MKRMFASLMLVCASFLIAPQSAQGIITIDMVTVGNPGNPADTRYIDSYHPNGVGSVVDLFHIGTTEVTNAQYAEFLNAVAASDPYGLYSTSMGSSTWGGIVRSGASGSYSYLVKSPAVSGAYPYDDKPVVFVSFGDAMRFANWLHNGQPTGAPGAGTTEDGAYTLNGAVTDAALAAVTRNADALWWLPSEDEWYKAAYHKNDGVTGNYWDYPTGTNSVPNNNPPSGDTGNSANFYDNGYTAGNNSYPMTDAGAYTLSDSPYGTFDQGGNVWEWNETLFGGSFLGSRNGSWGFDSGYLHASYWNYGSPAGDGISVGFRVASIPEPGSITLCLTGTLMLTLRRRVTLMQSKHLAVVAVCIWASALAAAPATAQQPDSATINGTIRSPVFGDHTWTLTFQGLSYFYHEAPSHYLEGTMTRVYATSFDFEFQGPHAEELNANVSEPLVNSGLQDGPSVEMISFTYFDEDWDWWVNARDWFIAVKPSDYQQGLSFRSEASYRVEDGIFAMDTNGYPVLAPFTSFGAHTSVYDNRPGSGYSMDIYPFGTVSVSSVAFSLPGDYNRDGAVNAADYVAWRKSPSNFGGDPDGYNTWRTHFGRTSGSSAAMGAASNLVVPEPSGLVLLTLAVPALLRRRKYPRN